MQNMSSKHWALCGVVVVVALAAVLAGAGAGVIVFALMCAVMMGAMVWMMMGGRGGSEDKHR